MIKTGYLGSLLVLFLTIDGSLQLEAGTGSSSTAYAQCGTSTAQLDTLCPQTQQIILDVINSVRRAPKAANMLKMVWDPVAAAQAQKWADLCIAKHGPTIRTSTKFGACGQNIANGNGITSWNQTFALWDAEIKDFTLGQEPCPDDKYMSVGHYTQDVWASSFQIGCGYNPCTNRPAGNFFVCHYCPPGNMDDGKVNVCKPYLPGTPAHGGVCGSCGGPNSLDCDNGLCTTPCHYANNSKCHIPDRTTPTIAYPLTESSGQAKGKTTSPDITSKATPDKSYFDLSNTWIASITVGVVSLILIALYAFYRYLCKKPQHRTVSATQLELGRPAPSPAKY